MHTYMQRMISRDIHFYICKSILVFMLNDSFSKLIRNMLEQFLGVLNISSWFRMSFSDLNLSDLYAINNTASKITSLLKLFEFKFEQ